ncbi:MULTISPECIES: Stk1 family PASTA domain-containing Ser/Thr kinase [unclassified Acutalibacter]|jgi:serine/threonine protein kinase|uniref:Stk1 family PASTA domain-containing Ser/Thr kinase n=1 Tax=unclassified Acutalibacter TaxID=2620728 RepID=UPI0014131A48|nr:MULTISPECIES: Stk1 family PASTA domain-containing Ser/Thr kinase [unclassified Acutalibacter]MCI9226338.1 Stk1 family PASTA domain-containing Ser/Thr kinase [Acutalibacter sp.]NBJ88034.1 Stk1 family PASTA domain-containing Ser/Thr kinase [Acutalibacter sp. 1XD8-36]
MDKYIGKRLDGKYEIHNLVGVGGMACVYRAYDRVEDRWVAIKILKDEFSNNSEFLRRFRNEAKAITVLSHPNIVDVYDVSFGDRLQYIVMEYIDGITLKQYIDQEGVIRWDEALHFTTQILMALEHAHEKGIIHRDIKPQNVMLLQDGSIKVTDFGIARFSQSETQTMTDKAIGSVHYIAPEQARGDYITDKADIYSVGVMLYEMATGRLPFVADNAVSVALMQLQAKPVMPRELNPSLPRGLEQITMHAMEKNPVDRFQSAGEMLDDIDRFRRNPSTVFHYDLQAGRADYNTPRNIESYDSARFKPNYNDSYEYEEEYVRSQRGARGAMAVKGVIAAAIIVLLAVGAVWLWNNSETLFTPEVDDQIEMPHFVGKIYDDILNDPEFSENFKFVRKEGNNPDLQPGEVMQQNPNKGIMVKKGSEVELLVNGQVEQVEVPVMENYTQADATALLKQLNLKVKYEEVAHDEIETGHVVTSDPQAKKMVDVGTTVTLKISKGPATKKTKVPDDLVGKKQYDVEAQLEGRKLKIGNIIPDDTSTQPEGTVVSTNPAPGSEVSEGATVDIVVSSGKGSTKTISKDISLPSVDMDINLKVYRNGTLVEEKTINPAYIGSSYNLTYTGTSGQETVVVQLNGNDYMYLSFNYDTKEATITQTIDFVPPSDNSGGDNPDSSGSSGGDDDGRGSGGGAISNN